MKSAVINNTSEIWKAWSENCERDEWMSRGEIFERWRSPSYIWFALIMVTSSRTVMKCTWRWPSSGKKFGRNQHQTSSTIALLVKRRQGSCLYPCTSSMIHRDCLLKGISVRSSCHHIAGGWWRNPYWWACAMSNAVRIVSKPSFTNLGYVRERVTELTGGYHCWN